MSDPTPVAYHVAASALAVGDVIIKRGKQNTIVSRFVDDMGTVNETVTLKMSNGEWLYFPPTKEVRIAA